MLAVCALVAIVVLCALLALGLVRLALALWWWCPLCWETIRTEERKDDEQS